MMGFYKFLIIYYKSVNVVTKQNKGVNIMKLEDIIRTYGKSTDYYDMYTGYTYHLPQMGEPDEEGNQKVPVSEDGTIIGTVTVNMTT